MGAGVSGDQSISRDSDKLKSHIGHAIFLPRVRERSALKKVPCEGKGDGISDAREPLEIADGSLLPEILTTR